MTVAPVLARQLAVHCGRPVSLLQLGLEGLAGGKILFFGWLGNEGQPALVCRWARSKVGERRLRREAWVRGAASKTRRLSAYLQEAQLLETPRGPVLLEEFIFGAPPPVATTAKEIEAYGKTTASWLSGLRAGTQADFCVDLSGRLFAAVELQVQFLAGLDLAGLLRNLQERLPALVWPAPCMVHGDFWRGNLRREGRWLRAVDWEHAELYGNPFFDAVLNLVSVAHERPGRLPGEWFEQMFLVQSEHSRLIGRLLDDCLGGRADRQAIAATVLQVATAQGARAAQAFVQTPGVFHRHASHQVLLRLCAQEDPIMAIVRSLWPPAA